MGAAESASALETDTHHHPQPNLRMVPPHTPTALCRLGIAVSDNEDIPRRLHRPDCYFVTSAAVSATQPTLWCACCTEVERKATVSGASMQIDRPAPAVREFVAPSLPFPPSTPMRRKQFAALLYPQSARMPPTRPMPLDPADIAALTAELNGALRDGMPVAVDPRHLIDESASRVFRQFGADPDAMRAFSPEDGDVVYHPPPSGGKVARLDTMPRDGYDFQYNRTDYADHAVATGGDMTAMKNTASQQEFLLDPITAEFADLFTSQCPDHDQLELYADLEKFIADVTAADGPLAAVERIVGAVKLSAPADLEFTPLPVRDSPTRNEIRHFAYHLICRELSQRLARSRSRCVRLKDVRMLRPGCSQFETKVVIPCIAAMVFRGRMLSQDVVPVDLPLPILERILGQVYQSLSPGAKLKRLPPLAAEVARRKRAGKQVSAEDEKIAAAAEAASNRSFLARTCRWAYFTYVRRPLVSWTTRYPGFSFREHTVLGLTRYFHATIRRNNRNARHALGIVPRRRGLLPQTLTEAEVRGCFNRFLGRTFALKHPLAPASVSMLTFFELLTCAVFTSYTWTRGLEFGRDEVWNTRVGIKQAEAIRRMDPTRKLTPAVTEQRDVKALFYNDPDDCDPDHPAAAEPTEASIGTETVVTAFDLEGVIRGKAKSNTSWVMENWAASGIFAALEQVERIVLTSLSAAGAGTPSVAGYGDHTRGARMMLLQNSMLYLPGAMQYANVFDTASTLHPSRKTAYEALGYIHLKDVRATLGSSTPIVTTLRGDFTYLCGLSVIMVTSVYPVCRQRPGVSGMIKLLQWFNSSVAPLPRSRNTRLTHVVCEAYLHAANTSLYAFLTTSDVKGELPVLTGYLSEPLWARAREKDAQLTANLGVPSSSSSSTEGVTEGYARDTIGTCPLLALGMLLVLATDSVVECILNRFAKSARPEDLSTFVDDLRSIRDRYAGVDSRDSSGAAYPHAAPASFLQATRKKPVK